VTLCHVLIYLQAKYEGTAPYHKKGRVVLEEVEEEFRVKQYVSLL